MQTRKQAGEGRRDGTIGEGNYFAGYHRPVFGLGKDEVPPLFPLRFSLGARSPRGSL